MSCAQGMLFAGVLGGVFAVLAGAAWLLTAEWLALRKAKRGME